MTKLAANSHFLFEIKNGAGYMIMRRFENRYYFFSKALTNFCSGKSNRINMAFKDAFHLIGT